MNVKLATASFYLNLVMKERERGVLWPVKRFWLWISINSRCLVCLILSKLGMRVIVRFFLVWFPAMMSYESFCMLFIDTMLTQCMYVTRCICSREIWSSNVWKSFKKDCELKSLHSRIFSCLMKPVL